MQYYELAGLRLSRVILGGHEYLPDGLSRGFNEDFTRAVTPGSIYPGFGGEQRRAVLRTAYDLGVNMFDVTMDAEKEALGRNLAEMPPPHEVYVQTRPEGFCYGYDPGNLKMLDLSLLRTEVQRCLKLLRRDSIDFFNFGILRDALDQAPDYLDRLVDNIKALQKEGLIRFATADTFSGEETFLAMIATGAFVSANINFNIAEEFAKRAVIPAARQRGMGVTVREIFMKSTLFAMGAEAGLADKDRIAKAAMTWTAAQPDITALIVGANTPEHLQHSASAIATARLDAQDEATLTALRATPLFATHQTTKRAEFFTET